MTQLSPHFTLSELIVTSTALNNTLDNDQHLVNLVYLAQGLERVRAACGGKPIKVNSAYRNKKVNTAVGGVPNSDHTNGFAADIRHADLPPRKLAETIRDSGIKFDQLILETSRNVVHISFAPRMRQMVLTQPKGPVSPFKQGIV